VKSVPKKHPRLQLKKDRKESIRWIAAVVPRYSNQDVAQPTVRRKTLDKPTGLGEYLRQNQEVTT
jgi:hypothetical protein